MVTFLILSVDPTVFLFSDNGLWRIAVAGASILFGLYFEDLYAKLYVKSRVLLIQQLSLVMGIALLAQGILGYVNDSFRLPLRLMVPACAVLVVALFAWRLAYSIFVLRVVGPQRILFVGMCAVLLEMAAYIAAHPGLGLEVIGYLDDTETAGTPDAVQLLGPLEELPRMVAQTLPDRIVVGLGERRGRMPVSDLLKLRYAGMAIDEAATAYEQLCGRVLLNELRPAEMLLSGAYRPRAQRLVYQSIGHWLMALALTILSAPLLLVTALLLRVSTRGPLLQCKKCAGFRGHTFGLYNFRLTDESGRLNAVQRFVARWHLHALPQLWNILRGEICFVGPRAERIEFSAELKQRIPFYRQRYLVKPGITGWAQINTPPGQPEDTLRRLEYDLYYLKHFSRALDAYILVHTMRELLVSGRAESEARP